MEARVAEIVFLVMFSFCLGAAATNAVESVVPYGVGHIMKEGTVHFGIRASFFGVMIFLSAICLLLGIRLCQRMEPRGFVGDLLNVLVLILLGMSPWLCNHVARLPFLPFSSGATIREEEFKYVDLVFTGIYLGIFLALLAVRALWFSLFSQPRT